MTDDSDVLRGWDDWFHETTEDEREAWCAWLRLHGIDPCDIPALDTWIVRDVHTRRISYPAWKRSPDGEVQPNEARTGLAREVRYMQLESPPLPFPEPR